MIAECFVSGRFAVHSEEERMEEQIMNGEPSSMQFLQDICHIFWVLDRQDVSRPNVRHKGGYGSVVKHVVRFCAAQAIPAFVPAARETCRSSVRVPLLDAWFDSGAPSGLTYSFGSAPFALLSAANVSVQRCHPPS